jgi:hypothetical protein
MNTNYLHVLEDFRLKVSHRPYRLEMRIHTSKNRECREREFTRILKDPGTIFCKPETRLEGGYYSEMKMSIIIVENQIEY